jgi:hypothetical protein
MCFLKQIRNKNEKLTFTTDSTIFFITIFGAHHRLLRIGASIFVQWCNSKKSEFMLPFNKCRDLLFPLIASTEYNQSPKALKLDLEASVLALGKDHCYTNFNTFQFQFQFPLSKAVVASR